APPRLPRIAVAVPSDDTSRLPTGSDGMPGSAGRPGTERPDNTEIGRASGRDAGISTEPASSVEATGISAGNMNGRVETSGMIAVPGRVSDETVDKARVTVPFAGRPAPPRLPRIAVAVPSDDTSRLPTGSDGMPGSAGRPGTERPDNT